MGAVLSIRGIILNPDVDRFSKAMHTRMIRVWNGAISAYIQAVANIVALHQDTGMSYASLFPTARLVKSKGMLLPLSPKVPSRPTYIDMSGMAHPGYHKNARLGEVAGEKCSTINYGSFRHPYFSFKFEIQVYQYLMNELGEWNLDAFESMSAGQQAMSDYLNQHAVEIFPAYNEYFNKLSLGIH